MRVAGEVFWRFEFTLHEGLIDGHLGGNVRQFTFLPGFDLLPHGFEVALHAVYANRDANDQ
jgi:hypothetical protein